MRRRQRRLRAQWRHEQQTVAMVLATVGHHSFGSTAHGAPRSQWTAHQHQRGGGERDEQRATAPDDSTPGDAAGASRGGGRAAGLLARCSSTAGLWSAVVVHASLGGHDGRRSRRWCPRLPHRACRGGREEGGGGQGGEGGGEAGGREGCGAVGEDRARYVAARHGRRRPVLLLAPPQQEGPHCDGKRKKKKRRKRTRRRP